MLDTLHIKNIALIEEETLDFFPGFSVLTGETGAGKSIIIGALNFALGERVSGKELIRTGAERASVEAVFSGPFSKSIQQLLANNQIEQEDDSLILTRDLSVSGRSVCRVNGCVVPVSVLKQFGDILIDIHGQHDHQSLLDVRTHTTMLDRFRMQETEPLLERTESAYYKAKAIEKNLKQLDTDARERERRLDLLRHQLNEIDMAQLQPDEEESLRQRKKILMNAQKIIDALALAKESLSGEDGVTDRLASAKRSVASLSDIGPAYSELANRIADAFYSLEDIADSVSVLFDESSFDEGQLEEVEQRLATIHSLERKYGSTVEEILAFRSSAGEEYEKLVHADESREDLSAAYKQSLADYQRYALSLSEIRHSAAKELKSALLTELKGLGMTNASFDVTFTPLEGNLPSAKGTETVEFLLSANKGEVPKPLQKVASGGEVSRVMLAFKRALADSDEIPTMIFDEIDSGISGMIGNAVAEKMQQIGKDRQVICITHLPQIAAAANRQYHVYKTETESKTVSGVRMLNADERAAEIARIMGSNPSDTVALEHAMLLIKQMSHNNA